MVGCQVGYLLLVDRQLDDCCLLYYERLFFKDFVIEKCVVLDTFL